MPLRGRRNWIVTVGLLGAAFAFRLFYGLSMPFWTEDERQVYLIGLRSFARGEWPYFGADVVWSGGQVPGALLGSLVRWPLSLWPVPEAPVVLLNVLSFAALALFAWYLSRRLPDVPRWLIVGALFTLPWTLNFSTHIVNPSYVLTGAIVFFSGFLEGMPAMRRAIVPFAVAWAFMGAGLFFVMQIHMSWVLLPPYVLAAAIGILVSRTDQLGMTRARAALGAAGGFLLGAAITGSLLAPTILRDGVGAGHVGGVVTFHMQTAFGLVTTAARVLSFASFELNRFLGLSRADRLLMLWRNPWVVPFALVVFLAGVVQPLWMFVTAFRRSRGDRGDWPRVRVLMAATIGLVYVSFFWSVRGPQAHSFYVVFPVAALFAGSCWQISAEAAGARMRRWERVAAVVLVSGVIMHAGLAIDRWPRQSLYVDRPIVAAAIAERNDRYLGDRRDTLEVPEDHRPRTVDRVDDAEAFLAARATDDLQIVQFTWRPVSIPLVGSISSLSLTVTNRSHAVAWLDIRYATVYAGADGRALTTREGVIKQILQPGETREWRDVPDGDVPQGTTHATFAITGAERVVPAR